MAHATTVATVTVYSTDRRDLQAHVGTVRGIDAFGAGLALLALLPFCMLPLAEYRADRISDGRLISIMDLCQSSYIGSVAGQTLIILAFLGVISVVALAYRSTIAKLIGASATTLVPVVAISLLCHPGDNLVTIERAARVTLGTGFWLSEVIWLLVLLDVLQQLTNKRARFMLLLLPTLVAIISIDQHLWDNLSVIREWRATEDLYWRAVIEHVKLASTTTLGAALVGMPLGFILHRFPKSANAVKLCLHFLHTVPSLALFGLLMLPLSYLSQAYPLLSDFGIHGIGVAPAWCALFIYALLPMYSTILSGLEAIPFSVIEAARGVGLSGWQIFWAVEFPLCRLSLVGALSVTLVQMMGLATIAALIGGGGLGALIFNGLGQNAPDLVLLGTLSVVGLSVLSQSLLPRQSKTDRVDAKRSDELTINPSQTPQP